MSTVERMRGEEEEEDAKNKRPPPHPHPRRVVYRRSACIRPREWDTRECAFQLLSEGCMWQQPSNHGSFKQ